MSKFVDRLRNLTKSSVAPIGFRSSVTEPTSPRLLLIAGLSGLEAKEARVVADVKADAGLILSEGASAGIIRQTLEALGDIPLGVFIGGTGDSQVEELTKSRCDFVVFNVTTTARLLEGEGVGKLLLIEPSLDHGLLRAINSLKVDGVIISHGTRDSFLSVEHLLVCRRFVELLDKPVMMALPSSVSKSELIDLWEVGIDGIVTHSTQSSEALGELKRMIGDLPGGARGRRVKAGVVLPRYRESAGDEEDETEEDV